MRRLLDLYRGRGLSGNVRNLGLTSFFQDVASEMVYPLLPGFLVSLGGGAAVLGVMESAAEGALALVKGWAGRWSDRVGRRKPFVVSGYGLSALTRPLMAAALATWHLVSLRVVDRLGKGLRTAPRDALISDSIEPGRRTFAFAFHRGLDHLGAAAGPLVAAVVLWLAPGSVRLVFALATVPAVLGVLVVVTRVREPTYRLPNTSPSAPTPKPRSGETEAEGSRADGWQPYLEGGGWRGAEGSHGGAASRPQEGERAAVGNRPATGPAARPSKHNESSLLRPPPSLRLPLLAFFLFSLGNASDAFLLLKAADVGLAPLQLTLLWSAFHVAKWLASAPLGSLADRIGPSRPLLAGWALYAGVYVGFGRVDDASTLVALFAVYAVFYGLTEGASRALVVALAGESAGVGTTLGAFHLASGLGLFGASLLFGVIWELVGSAAAFFLGAALATLAAVVLAVSLRGNEPAGL